MRAKLPYRLATCFLLLASQAAHSAAQDAILLQGGTIVTFNPTSSTVEVHRDSSLLIKNDRIVSISNDINPTLPPEVEEETIQIVNVTNKILTPGLIDTHHHLWQTAYRTTLPNTTLMHYMLRNSEYAPITHAFTPEDVYLGQLMGIYESLNAGVTTILDHAHHTWSAGTAEAGLRASVDSGARVVWAYAVRDVGERFTVEEQRRDFERLARDREGVWRGSPVTVGLAYDMFWNASQGEAREILELARDVNASVITCHYVGGAYGAVNKNSIELLNTFSALNSTIPLVFSHGTSFNAHDAILLRQHNHFLSLVPESDHHYGIGMPHQHLILDQSSLGVDTHCTFSGDLVSQARFWLQTVRLRVLESQVLSAFNGPAGSPMSVNQAFALMTRNGGMALRREDIGVLVPGAKADVVVWSGDSVNMLGWTDPVAAVVLHSNVGDVEHVLVDGKFVKRDGVLVGVDGGVKERFLESARRIQGVLKETPEVVLEGEFLEGTKYVVADPVDTLRGLGNGY